MEPFALLVTQLGVLLIAGSVLGGLAQRLGLPAVVGELLAGVLLGPTLLGGAWPSLFEALFPAEDPAREIRTDFLRVGLLLFLFVVGREVDAEMVLKRARTIIPISLCGVMIPFAVGFVSVLLLPGVWRSPMAEAPLALPLMIGVALSVSALPVIARIMADLGLVQTETGRVILSAAIIDDLLGWMAFAAVAGAFVSSAQAGQPLWVASLIVVLGMALTLTSSRVLGSRAASWLRRHPRQAPLGLGLVLGATLLAAAVMERAGVHAFFGALMIGIATSQIGEEVFEPVARLVRSFFTPLYFGAVGISLDFASNFDPLLVALVLLIACAGKLIGVTIGARLGGCSPRDSLAIAAGMNARGAVEILLATIARQAGLIDDRIFVALVVMALATSVIAGPLMQRILDVAPLAKLVKAHLPVLQRLDPYGRPFDEIEIGPALTIGRHEQNRLSLPHDERVSREHAVVREVRGRFLLEDLNSSNGTLIWRDARWQDVTADELSDGDVFGVGRNVFRFSVGADTKRG